MTSMNEEFVAIGESYSKAHGAFIPKWKTDVNLAPPTSYGKQVRREDQYLGDYYNSLQYTLLETGHPETIDRTPTPRTNHNGGRLTVAILSSPFEIVGLLLAGGKQAPDAFHLVLSTTWLSKTDEDGCPSHTGLWVSKAITFHRNGISYIDEFKPSRKVTYFLDFFTENVTGGQRNDGEKFETGLDCPMSSSVVLSELIDNKVWTRAIMADVGMAYPVTLAFVYKSKHALHIKADNINVIDLVDKERYDVTADIKRFLYGTSINDVDMIVVKPSGPRCYGSIGVSYHHKQDVTGIIDAAVDLLTDTQPGSAVLVEQYIKPILPQHKSKTHMLWGADDSLSFRVRATVYRDFNDKPVTTLVSCGIMSSDCPINGDNTVSQSLNSTLIAYGMFDSHQREGIEKAVRRQCEDVLGEIMEREKSLTIEQRGGVRAQTDVIGVDMILTTKDETVVPVGIEVNSHDCTINCQIYEFVQELYTQAVSIGQAPDKVSSLGESYLPWIQNILHRSQLYLMRNKTVLIVGSGGFSKRFVWSSCLEYGINVVLIDSSTQCPAREEVDVFIPYDYTNHTLDEEHAINITTLITNRGIIVDGCVTFWEDCGPLTALLREALNLANNGVNYEAAINAKQKSRVLEILRSRKDDTPHWPRSYLYSSASHRIVDRETLVTATKEVDFPAIVKLEHGSSAVGVKLVHSKDELEAEYDLVNTKLRNEEDYPGIGLGYNNTLVLMEYHPGTEHDVDVIIYERKLIAAFISDNGPTREPVFIETVAVMPSLLPMDKQAQLVAAAYQSCVEIGLTNGTFNVELKMTPTGPKLLEINARMGGFYLRDWIKRLYNIDLVLVSAMIACGIQPFVPKHSPSTYIMGTMLIPSLHSHVLNSDVTKKEVMSLITSGEVIWNQFSDTIESGSEYEEPFANIAVESHTIKETRDQLLTVCRELDIDSETYMLEQYIPGMVPTVGGMLKR